MTNSISCEVAGRCSGCPDILIPYETQLEKKAEGLRELARTAGLAPGVWDGLVIESLGAGGLRERIDLVVSPSPTGPVAGLYESGTRDVIALGPCPQLTPETRAWLETFAGRLPAGERGSARLRVAPDGRLGVWLDFSNEATKRLLDEGNWLRWLRERAVVEIGQRRKRLVDKAERLGLGEAVLAPWTETYAAGRAISLLCAIGSFTQVGRAANRALAAAIEAWAPSSGRVVELGSGVGTLTIPLLARGLEIHAVETDPLSLEGLAASVAAAGLGEGLRAEKLSFCAPGPRLPELMSGASGVVADPPRSGLLEFPVSLGRLAPHERPKTIVYVACAPESFVSDVAALAPLGYDLTELRALDLFPQTPHLELLGRLEKR